MVKMSNVQLTLNEIQLIKQLVLAEKAKNKIMKSRSNKTLLDSLDGIFTSEENIFPEKAEET